LLKNNNISYLKKPKKEENGFWNVSDIDLDEFLKDVDKKTIIYNSDVGYGKNIKQKKEENHM